MTSSERPYLKDPVNICHPGMREWWGSSKEPQEEPPKSFLLSLLFSLSLFPLFNFSNRRQSWPWFVRKSNMFLFIVMTLILYADFLFFYGVASDRVISLTWDFFHPIIYSFCRISNLPQNANLGALSPCTLPNTGPDMSIPSACVHFQGLSIPRVFQWLL